MRDAILVINAGSSSVKFSLFAEAGKDLELVARGQLEGIYTAPHFVAKDASGKSTAEKRWEAGVLGHDRALAHIVGWLKGTQSKDFRVIAVGHRVVHGGTDYAAPVRIDRTAIEGLTRLVPLAPLHQPHKPSQCPAFRSKKIGKVPVQVRNSPGFVVNRMLCPMINEAVFALGEGLATAAEIDEAMKLGCNHPLGPLTLCDLIGLDVALAVMNVLFEGFKDPKYRPAPLLVEMVDAGYLGRKSGRGFFAYT